MTSVENVNVLFLNEDDLRNHFKYDPGKTKIECIRSFKHGVDHKMLRAGVAIFTDRKGNTTVVKNRYF